MTQTFSKRRLVIKATVLFIVLINIYIAYQTSISFLNASNESQLFDQDSVLSKKLDDNSTIGNLSKQKNTTILQNTPDIPPLSNKNDTLNNTSEFSLRSNWLETHPHPHAGARYANGTFGYVADPYAVRKHIISIFRNESQKPDATIDDMFRFLPLKPDEEEKVCGLLPGKGLEKNSFNLLTRKVQIGGPDPLPFNVTRDQLKPYRNRPTPPKVFCGLYSYEKNHNLVEAISQTWGWRCDGFLAFSTKTVENIGAVDLPHQGKENYNNMWQKVRSIWSYIHDNFYDDFDYFHLSGDDNHFVIENMRNYLWSIDDDNGLKKLYLGHQYKTRGKKICGGGAGYTLNRAALRVLIKEILPLRGVNLTDSGEDRVIGTFLKMHHIGCHDTADARGEQRYTGLEPNFVATSDGKHRFFKVLYNLWAADHGWKIKEDLISSQHVAWHLLRTPVWQKRIHAVMYRTCPIGTNLGDAFEDF